MRFQVPQFIGVEDKIFGPLTAKQFLYVAGSVSITFIIFNLVPSKIIAFIFAVPIAGFFIALAFYRYNEQPFIVTVESAIKYFFGSRMYIWKKVPKTPKQIDKDKDDPLSGQTIPKLSNSNLRDLSWSLDVQEKIDE